MSAPPTPAVSSRIGRISGTVLGILLMLCALALIGWAAVVAVREIGTQSSLVATAIVGGLGWIIKSSIERRREYERALAESKRDQYGKFLEIMNKLLSVKGARELSSDDLDELRLWSLRLGLIGSDHVVQAWNKVRLIGQGDAQHVLDEWSTLVLAMRRDCGHTNTRLRAKELLTLFVNEPVVDRQLAEGPTKHHGAR